MKTDTESFIERVVSGDVVEVRKGLACGIDPNRHYKGRSALNWACQGPEEYVEVVSSLVEAGADVNSEDESGFTPLVTASGEGQFFVTDFLLRMGALPQLKARAIGGNALHLACAWGHRDIVVMLVEQSKVDLILADDAGLTPLDHAKLGGFQSIVDYLQGRVQK